MALVTIAIPDFLQATLARVLAVSGPATVENLVTAYLNAQAATFSSLDALSTRLAALTPADKAQIPPVIQQKLGLSNAVST